MIDKLEKIHERYIEVEKLISSPEVVSDMKLYIQLSKEYKELDPIINAYKEYSNLISNINEAKEILKSSDDSEMKDMAKLELEEKIPKKEEMDEEIKVLLIPKDLLILRMLLWKSEQVLVEMKRVFLQEIYIRCIPLLLLLKDGR